MLLLLNRWWDSGSNQGAQCVTAVGMKRHEMAPNRPETDKKTQKDTQIDLFMVFSTFVMDKLGRYSSAKLRKFTDACMVGDKFVPPTIQTSVKFRDFEKVYPR